MRRLKIRKLAKAEIIAAFEWYLKRSPSAAHQFLNAVDEAMTIIEETPLSHPVIRGRLRRVLVRHFPYAVYYKVFPSTISVVGVIHGHRHPETWMQRAAP